MTPRQKGIGCLTLVGIVIVIVVIAAIIGATHKGGSGGSGNSSAGPTSYSSTVTSAVAIDPGHLKITWNTTNTGGSSGTPTCAVGASAIGEPFSGSDVFTPPSSLDAGATRTDSDVIAITNGGAASINTSDPQQVWATCS
jgi:hypothetical protein